MRPYEAALDYFEAGWRGILPLPAGGKYPPPAETTGATGHDTSYADVVAWIEDRPESNIGLRLPDGVIGIDVDAYGDKPGGETFQALQDTLGVLPKTLAATSRDDEVSGIRLFAVPLGTRCIPALPGIDIIQRHHRYAVVAPSVHPSGGIYEWRDSHTMAVVEGIPKVADLPELPAAWLAHLTTIQGPATKTNADPREVMLGFPEGEPCQHILKSAAMCMNEDEGRHDAYTAGILSLAHAARLGCPGGTMMLHSLRGPFVDAIQDRASRNEAEAEYARMIEGAMRIVAAEPQGEACSEDLSWIVTPADMAVEEERAQWARMVNAKADSLRLVEEARAENKRRQLGDLPDLELESLSDVLEQEDDQDVWVVEDMWPDQGRTLLVAAAKTGKTTLVTRNLLRCLADGGTFLGRYEVKPLERKVLFLNLEVAPNTVRQWMRSSRIVDTEKIVVANLRGKVSALDISTPEGRHRLAESFRASDIGTVILDPLAPLLAVLGLDENSNGDIARFWAWWSETLALAGVENDLVVHHAGHGGQRSRGASRLLDEPDAIWTMYRDEEADLRLLKAMGRDVDLGDTVLTFDPENGSMGLLEGTTAQVTADKLQEIQERHLFLTLTGKDRVSRVGLFRDAPGIDTDTDKALSSLVRRGLVIELPNNYYRMASNVG